jgi:hypothetical protein
MNGSITSGLSTQYSVTVTRTRSSEGRKWYRAASRLSHESAFIRQIPKYFSGDKSVMQISRFGMQKPIHDHGVAAKCQLAYITWKPRLIDNDVRERNCQRGKPGLPKEDRLTSRRLLSFIWRCTRWTARSMALELLTATTRKGN